MNNQPHTPTPPPVSFTEWNREETARILRREHPSYHRVIRHARQGAEARKTFWRDYISWCEREGKQPATE